MGEDDEVLKAVGVNLPAMDEWDLEMEADFSLGGRGYHLLEKVKADIAAGKFRPLSERPEHQ